VTGEPPQARLFPAEGQWCGGCVLRVGCGSIETDQVCPALSDAVTAAGIHVIHPARPDFEATFKTVGGIQFDDIVAKPHASITLQAYLPQVRWRSGFRREAIAVPRVAVRLDDVFRGGRIRTAEDLRQHIGLDRTTEVGLLLFTRDEVLERFADGGSRLLDDIANGGYAFVVPPSFSLWAPQRRPDNLLSLRRSMLTYEALQLRGVTTVPRVGWVERLDMERFARWVNDNPTVTTVAIDLMTYSTRDFDRHTRLMAEFDTLTGERLHYLANGVTSMKHIAALYLAASANRVMISDSTMGKAPRRGSNGRWQRGFRPRARLLELRCAEARSLADVLDERFSLEDILAGASVRAVPPEESSLGIASRHPSRKAAA